MTNYCKSTFAGSLLAFAFIVVPFLSAETFYVSPDGNDAWSGTHARPNAEKTDGPLATLAGARDAVRYVKAQGPLHKTIRVIVADGIYTMTEPFVLTPQDSGTAKYPVVYQAAEGAKPVFSAGRKIEGLTENESGVFSVHIPEVADGKWYFESLWVNGQRAVRARTPNQSYFYMRQVEEEKLQGAEQTIATVARQTVSVDEESLQTLLPLSDSELRDVTMQVYHKWDTARRFPERIDFQESLIITSGRGMKPWNKWTGGTRFHLENYKAALDAPGEWFLDRDGTLSYLPRASETIDEVVAPTAVEQFILVQGNPTAGQFVEHIQLQGLAFKHAGWAMPPGGFEPTQAAASIDAVVMLDGARNVVIQDIRIGHIGRYGVWFRKGCQNCTLERAYLYDLGAGGVRIGEAGIAKNENDYTSRISVHNSIIHHGGRIFPCAVGIWIGQSGDNRITHNDIADLFYTGISVGWRWGYAESLAKRNLIAFNRVRHIGRGVLCDMGGIYTLGPSEGTVVRNNVFHDIFCYQYGGWGLYTDEGSSHILMENNLVYNTQTGGFHQHFGKENIIRNNILAFGQLQQFQATRIEDHLSFTFEKNIIYYTDGTLDSSRWKEVRMRADHNCYWDASGREVKLTAMSMKEWQDKHQRDKNSIVAEPLFENPQAYDFRLKPESPVFKLGFKPFDYSTAGVYGDRDWVRLAKDAPMPPQR